jgi:type II secretory pathway pseudopilin PulG
MTINQRQRGQTLVETMVAVFVMVMGITAALGLASYSLNASTGIRKQIIGMGLAREGIEAVKNMRDTNWLQGTLSSDCYKFITGSTGDPEQSPANCYKDWLRPSGDNGYDFNYNGDEQSYRLIFDANNERFWRLQPAGDRWGLENSTDPFLGLYTISSIENGNDVAPSGYYRKITITPMAIAPFDKPNEKDSDWPRLTITSQVWWTDKNCPASQDWPGENKCSIQLKTYLTNWKTF